MASIQKVANKTGRGTGKYKYRVMWREDGRQRNRTFQERLEAKEFAVKIEKGESVVTANHTFEDLVKQFLVDCETDFDIKSSTLADYRQILNNHLLPVWRHKKLLKLRKQHVFELKASLPKELTSTTVRKVLVVATRVLNHAIELEWLQTNVAADVKKPKRNKGPIYILRDADQRALMSAAKPNCKMLFHLALRSGLRKGELLGLQWNSVDLFAGTVHVREQFTHGAHATPKTDAGNRKVPIGPDTVEQLKRWRAVGRRPVDDLDLVFPSGTGRYQSASNVHHRQWKPALKRAGLPSTVRFHDLRHTYASELIAANVPLNDLKVVLGHTEIAVTADIYGHLLTSSHDRIRSVAATTPLPDAVEQPIVAVNG